MSRVRNPGSGKKPVNTPARGGHVDKPPRGSGGNKPAGGSLGLKAVPYTEANSPAARLRLIASQGGEAALERAREIAALPIYEPMVVNGQPVRDEFGQPVMRVAENRLPSILNAAALVMNREWGAPKEKVETENVHRVVSDRPMTAEEWVREHGSVEARRALPKGH
ncbi:MAG: hypothetical protein KGL39_24105 [Patescibacteria group bacterium]|nr:hypothetical protein [Patescibacteria group bacterium]